MTEHTVGEWREAKYYYLHSLKSPTEADPERVEAAWPDYVHDWSGALEVAPGVQVRIIAYGDPGALLAVRSTLADAQGGSQ